MKKGAKLLQQLLLIEGNEARAEAVAQLRTRHLRKLADHCLLGEAVLNESEAHERLLGQIGAATVVRFCRGKGRAR